MKEAPSGFLGVDSFRGPLAAFDFVVLALYVTAISRRVVVVRALMKKTQKTPRAEIELALRRAREII
jgi:hypothetical protein